MMSLATHGDNVECCLEDAPVPSVVIGSFPPRTAQSETRKTHTEQQYYEYNQVALAINSMPNNAKKQNLRDASRHHPNAAHGS